MKRAMFLGGFIACCLFAFYGAFTACSSDDDLSTYNEGDDTSRIEATKTKVLNLAEKYGLNIEPGENFGKEVLDNKINLDSIEAEFRGLARLKGSYTLMQRKGNNIIFDSNRERRLKRRDFYVMPYRDLYGGEYQYRGDITDPSNFRTLDVKFTLKWSLNANGIKDDNDSYVKIMGASENEVEIDDHNDGKKYLTYAPVTGLYSNPTGAYVSFNYNFQFAITKIDEYGNPVYKVRYTVNGYYSLTKMEDDSGAENYSESSRIDIS